MGFFKKLLEGDTPEVAEPSFSRQWIARTGGKPRKTELALAALARMGKSDVATRDAYGQPLTADSLSQARAVILDVLIQDRSLSAWVARDCALLFESLGGLGPNREAMLASVGLLPEPSGPRASASASFIRPEHAFALDTAFAVDALAHVTNGGAGAPPATPEQKRLYDSMFTGSDDATRESAVARAAWAAVVVQRTRSAGHIDGDVPVFNPALASFASMVEHGWYPNPQNSGDISTGTAEIERFWDGDWTARTRRLIGRRWDESELSMFSTPNN